VLLLLPWERDHLRLLARRFGLALGLGLLLAAPFLLPLLHFMPQFAKDLEVGFPSAQPFTFVPLNFVIDDLKFYSSDMLHKNPYPFPYPLFIGWFPVLLALWALRGARDRLEQRTILFLVTVALIALWVVSAVPLIWLSALPIPGLAAGLAGIRYPSMVGGLAVPAVLGLSAIGLDRVLRWNWPRLRLTFALQSGAGFPIAPDFRWLLVIPLVLALNDARAFGSTWLTTTRLPPVVSRVLDAIRTPDLEWVYIPLGEHFFVEPAVAGGLKIADDMRTWRWNNRPNPDAVFEVGAGSGARPGVEPAQTVEGYTIYKAPPGREYAAITHSDGTRTVCQAQGTGGDIDVTCDAPRDGVLSVRENSWTGWQAQAEGRSLDVQSARWLTVNLPAGPHVVQFRYRPWDVPLGIVLALSGVALAVYQWRKPDPPVTLWPELATSR
jgi:hypothetical protein